MKDKEDTNENLRDREKGMINLNLQGSDPGRNCTGICRKS